MSIASEIQRLQGVKSDILEAIADKGVTVPAGSALADCPELIGSIGGGSLPDNIKLLTALYYQDSVGDCVKDLNLPISTTDEILLESAFVWGATYPQNVYEYFFDVSGFILTVGVMMQNNCNSNPVVRIYLSGELYYSSMSYNQLQKGFLLRIKRNACSINDILIPKDSGTFATESGTLNAVFCNSSKAHPVALPIIHLRINDSDGNIKYDFYPAKDTSSNLLGLWENKTGTFFAAGSGAYRAGLEFATWPRNRAKSG